MYSFISIFDPIFCAFAHVLGDQIFPQPYFLEGTATKPQWHFQSAHSGAERGPGGIQALSSASHKSGAVDLGMELENIPMPGALCTHCRARAGVLMRDSAHHKPETLENISKNANLHVLGLIEEISDGKILLSLQKQVLNTNFVSPLDMAKYFKLLHKPIGTRKVVGSQKFSSAFQTFFICVDISMRLLHQAWRICGILHQKTRKEHEYFLRCSPGHVFFIGKDTLLHAKYQFFSVGATLLFYACTLIQGFLHIEIITGCFYLCLI